MKKNSSLERATTVVEEFGTLLKKHKLAARPIILFPNGKLPLLSKIALWIVQKQGGRNDLQFIDLSK